jgi:hypothetical protein
MVNGSLCTVSVNLSAFFKVKLFFLIFDDRTKIVPSINKMFCCAALICYVINSLALSLFFGSSIGLYVMFVHHGSALLNWELLVSLRWPVIEHH